MTTKVPVVPYLKFAIMLISRVERDTAYIHITNGQNITRVLDRDNRIDKSLDPKTKHGAPHWEVVAVIGPMHGITEFCRIWRADISADRVSNEKTLEEALARGIHAANQGGLTVYQ
jgi:hypothetical protein